MFDLTWPFVISLTIFSTASYSQPKGEKNVLLVHSSAPLAFDKLTVPMVREAVSTVLSVSDERVTKISSVPAGQHNFLNTLAALDELQYNLTSLSFKLGLMESTSVDDSLRNVSTEENNKIILYNSNLFLNDGLYQSLKQFAKSTRAGQLTASQKKYLFDNIDIFEKNGMKLPLEQRIELEKVNKKLIEIESRFNKNISESKDSIVLTSEELNGVPEMDRAPWKRPGDSFVVDINTPNVISIGANVERSDVRRKFYERYLNLAYPENMDVLDSLFYYRQVLATRLGFKSFAEYALVGKMAATPKNVWAFQNNLIEKLTPRVTEELKALQALKHKLHPEENDTIFSWDVNFYKKKLLDDKYALKENEVKEYFEINNTLKGMFAVYEQLFNISVKKAANVPVWHEKVMAFDIFMDGKKAGTFYLDLYPRANKYHHFACFPISQYRKSNGAEVLPAAALVCNYNEGSQDSPSLLPHNEVVGLFHEFGHLVHMLLGRPAIASQGPFNVKGDFIEAPSQLLENWCWEYPSLQIFARHYKTGAVLPKPLYEKMKSAQNANTGIYYTRQLYFGLLDFTFEDKYEEIRREGIENTEKKLFVINQIPYPEGTHLIASFGHLTGYGAAYYGYLWSRVFAEDMFSVFKKNGVLDRPTGIRYRKEVLEKGSSEEETDMLRSFLGREPNSKAFLRSLGIGE